MKEAIWEVDLEEVGEYVLRRHNPAVQCIVTRPVLYLCDEAVQRPRTRVSKRWW